MKVSVIFTLGFYILEMCIDCVNSCHSVQMFPSLPTLPSNPIFSGFAPILSQFPLFASLVPRPPQRDHVITTGKCAGGEIKIVTVFPWKNTTINRNIGHMDYELSRLQKYSGISTNEFCPEITKTPVQHNSNFAVIYRFPYLTSTCDRLRLFVRNAVSWSSEVSRARVACECDKTVELIRG